MSSSKLIYIGLGAVALFGIAFSIPSTLSSLILTAAAVVGMAVLLAKSLL